MRPNLCTRVASKLLQHTVYMYVHIGINVLISFIITVGGPPGFKIGKWDCFPIGGSVDGRLTPFKDPRKRTGKAGKIRAG